MLHILDGSAFQSTVRFMMEMNLSGIERYYRSFEEIVSVLRPRMVYLRPCEVVSHSRLTSARRGRGWSRKVAAYLERTDYCVLHGLSGQEGMHRFWESYAQRCDELVTQTSIPTKTITTAGEDWERHMSEATDFLAIKGADK